MKWYVAQSILALTICSLIAAGVQADERYRQHDQGARATYGRGAPPPPRAPQAGDPNLSLIRHRAEQLASEFEHLVEEAAIEVRGRSGRQLISQAEQAQQQVQHFRRALRADIGQEHLYRDFVEMDVEVHDFLDAVLSAGANGILAEQAARVDQADQRLHAALVNALETRRPHRDTIALLAHALDDAGQRLDRTADYVLGGRGRTEDLREAIHDFANQAEHFHKAYEKQASLEHVQRDFRELSSSWRDLVDTLNQLPLRGDQAFLLRQAQRANLVHQQLHNMLNMQGRAPQIALGVQYDRGRRDSEYGRYEYPRRYEEYGGQREREVFAPAPWGSRERAYRYDGDRYDQDYGDPYGRRYERRETYYPGRGGRDSERDRDGSRIGGRIGSLIGEAIGGREGAVLGGQLGAEIGSEADQ